MDNGIKISIPQTYHENVRRYFDTDKIHVHWGDNKEIRLSAVLDFVLKQIKKEEQGVSQLCEIALAEDEKC